MIMWTRCYFAWCIALVCGERPFVQIEKAHRMFTLLKFRHQKYDEAVAAIAPMYDLNREPGPPFDMYYHLEELDRIRANMTTVLERAQTEWDQLGYIPGTA